MSGDTCCYEPNVLKEYNKTPEDIKDIQSNQYTGNLQITFKNGDRIWIDPKIKISDNSIDATLSISLIPHNLPCPGEEETIDEQT